ncbi:MAG: septum site-determining protein MinC [Armatimonadaceae bacterium]
MQVEVKGWRYGLLIVIPPAGEWSEVIERIHEKLDEAKARSFWRGSQTTFDFGERRITEEELQKLRDRVRGGFGLIPFAVVTTQSETREVAAAAGLEVYEELPTFKNPPRERTEERPDRTDRAKDTPASPETTAAPEAPADKQPAAETIRNNALYLVGTVRSGQRISHDGHLIIGGDVNAGAEVMAGGDIVVVGTLRGLAHAGCYGDESARIIAGSLRPHQLRIAGKIARAPEEEPASRSGRGDAARPESARPEVARIESGEIGIFPL